MAQEQPISSVRAPAQLLLGPQDIVSLHAEQYAQKMFCKNNACTVCFTCQAVRKRQHHAMLWLRPEKNYVVDDLDIIFEITALALNPGDSFLFILEKADCLTPACGNKLLKIVEEPPAGYQFILCAEQGDALLPTIKSRCAITPFFVDAQKQIHEKLASFFIGTADNPVDFLKELDASKINEHESLALIDLLISHWTKKYKGAVQANDREQQRIAEKKIELFSRSLLTPPMPGSSKIFWKNIFLRNN